MKQNIIISLLVAMSSVSTMSAAVVSVTNNLANLTVGITESDGLPGTAVATRGFNTTEAFMTFGYFSITDAAIQSATSATTLYSSLVTLGNNQRNFTATTVGSNGFATAAMQAAVTITGSAFENKNIYVFVANVANSASLAASSQVFVMKLDQTFLATWDSLANNTVTFGTSSGTVLLGGFDNYQFKTRTADDSTGAAWNTVSLPIPETSTSLLGAIGALALLRRRRN